MRSTPAFETSAAGASPARADGFDSLGLLPALREAVRAAGYREPTPIQRKAIPHVLAGRDVLGCAQTGTGKTAAFALPILHQLLATPRSDGHPAIRALVLAPTRELAAQIGESFRHYGARSRLRHHVVFGGVGKRPQIEALRRGLDVLVATPGRLLDLLRDRHVALGRVQYFVLDEADRMLDMGFIHDVRCIARELPEDRQTLLFSATLPREIQELAGRLLADPVRVAVDPVASTCEPIAQSVYFVDAGRKVDLLLRLLHGDEVDRALVFTRTKHGANRLAGQLDRGRVAVAAIHGNKSQPARERALEGLKRGHTRVVVATDIAARGLDVKGLSHVINFDLPRDPESYVHRVGRTGRAGASGVALSLCSAAERPLLLAIERLTRRRLERLETPAGLAAAPAPHEGTANPRRRRPRAG
jgi:ATP-dependent RNA helicase RhlE